MNKEIEQLKTQGFKGFKSVKELRTSLEGLPVEKGVYAVIRDKETAPTFVEKGTGGYHKQRDPNVPTVELNDNWVEGTTIVYIGQTNRNLKKRIGELIKFGQGKAVGHWGGRLLWQLADAEELIVAWKELSDSDTMAMERNLLDKFKSIYLKLPFANLK